MYYKHTTIVNDDSSIVNKFETSLTDDARVIIYDCHMFIVQATGWRSLPVKKHSRLFVQGNNDEEKYIS